MNRADVLRMAKEAGLSVTPPRSGEYDGGRLGGDVVSLVRFAALVAAHEREACAAQVQSWDTAITDKLAAEIRARGAA